MELNKNIRQATVRDLGKLGEWKAHFEEEVIIQAIYPMTTRSNTPYARCESDSHQIRDLGSLLFSKRE